MGSGRVRRLFSFNSVVERIAYNSQMVSYACLLAKNRHILQLGSQKLANARTLSAIFDSSLATDRKVQTARTGVR